MREKTADEGKKGVGGSPASKGRPARFSEFSYIYQNLVKYPARYVMTVSALTLCIVFFILVASLSLGLQEELEGGLEVDEPVVGSEETAQEALEPKPAKLVDLEEDVKGTILYWLYFMGVMLFMTSGTAIATTMLINVRQREREIGILRAVGLKEGQVQRIFIYETLWMCTAGFIIGTLVGATLAANVFNAQYMAGSGGVFFAPARTPPVILVTALLLTFVTGLAATWYPARKASRMDPVEAMSG